MNWLFCQVVAVQRHFEGWLLATTLLLALGFVVPRTFADEPVVKNVERAIEGPPVEVQKLRREVQRLEAEVERLRKIVESRSNGESRPTSSAKPLAPGRVPSSTTVRPTQRFDGHQDIVTAVAIAADGTRGASVSHDASVRIWDLVRHVENSAFDTPDKQLYAVAWAPDGQLIAAGGMSGVHLLRADTGELLQSMSEKGWVQSLQFSRDGKALLSAGGNTVQVWDVATGTQRESHRLDLDITHKARWTRDQRSLLCVGGYYNNSSTKATYYVRLWEPDSGQELFRLDYPKRSTFRDARLIADDTRILTVDPAGSLREWDIATGKEHREWPLNGVVCLDLSADARHLVTAGKLLQLWDVVSVRLIDSYPLPEMGGQCVALSHDGKRAIVGSRDNAVRSFAFYELIRKAAKPTANEPATEEAGPMRRRSPAAENRPAQGRP